LPGLTYGPSAVNLSALNSMVPVMLIMTRLTEGRKVWPVAWDSVVGWVVVKVCNRKDNLALCVRPDFIVGDFALFTLVPLTLEDLRSYVFPIGRV